MNGRRAGGFVILVLAFAAASWIGWWMVPATALLWGALRPAMRRPAAAASAAAGIAAAAWLGGNVIIDGGSFAILSNRLAGLMSVPAPVLLGVTIVLPALLAWSAAAAGSALRPRPANPPQPNS